MTEENLTRKDIVLENVEVDRCFDSSLRPKTLSEYIGQQKLKENLNIYLEASKKRGGPLDHVLLYGPPGLGKTSLAHIIANELGVNIKSTSGPALERAGDLAAILTNLTDNDVLFIDEIHRLSTVVEEILYPAMEEFKLDLIIGQGPSARSIKIDLPRFTLIGATTRAGLLTSPLRDRFGMVFRLELYNEDELTQIVKRSAKILNVEIDASGAVEIAKRSRGTPRIANRLLKRVRDFADITSDGKISVAVADKALLAMEIDKMGLDKMDIKILSLIADKYGGGPVGIETISAAINEDKGTIEDVYEPFLIQAGWLDKTVRGRIATEKTFDHLGLKKRNSQQTLL